MRVVAVLTALASTFVLAGAGQTMDTQDRSKNRATNKKLIQDFYALEVQGEKWLALLGKRPARCPDAERAIVYYRAKVWGYQKLLNEPKSKTTYPEKRKNACGLKRWSAEEWRYRSQSYYKLIAKLDDEPTAICYVFGSYCKQALAVAWCESKYHRTAQNGQYLGLFQMGDSERRLFGHGPTPLEQARAAHRYFVASGRDWSPWSCRYAIYQ